VTSHLSGLFYRTIEMVEKGIKPIYVFDGIPIIAEAEDHRGEDEQEEGGAC
jgi:flap endonuclease-1